MTSHYKEIHVDVYLVEDGLVWADEAPLEHLLLPVRVLDRVADVEDLAVVGDISVVTVRSAVTGELVHYVFSKHNVKVLI